MPKSREFVIGETVHLNIRVNAPGTHKPVDPTNVRLTSLKRDGQTVPVSVVDFTRESAGTYSLTLPTDGLVAGIYDVVVTLDSGPTKVVKVPDRFVLRAA